MTLADIWQTSPKLPSVSVAEGMRAAARDEGKTQFTQIREFAGLNFGAGKVLPEEYYYYGLYANRYDESQRREFVGKRLEIGLHQITCDPHFWMLAHDKLGCYGVLQLLGFPVPRTLAVYRHGVSFPGVKSLADRDELTAALRTELTGPMFGKPARGIRSAGVLSIDGFDPATDSMRLAHGHTASVDELAEALETYADEGYLLQERVRQHPEVAAVCGETVGTVRIIILRGPDGPEPFRALWKLPSGTNVADNFWREGNILAALDLETGRVTRVIQGVGSKLREIDTHPTSGRRLTDYVLPDWTAARDLVLAASGAFPELRMQAWDIAFGADGPVLIEVNVGGDYNLPQLSAGKGMLEPRFRAFLEYCAKKRGLERKLRRLRLASKPR